MFLKHAKLPESVADEQDTLKRAKAGSMGRTEMNAFAKATNGSGASTTRDVRATVTETIAAARSLTACDLWARPNRDSQICRTTSGRS